jgi:hypothetical protein
VEATCSRAYPRSALGKRALDGLGSEKVCAQLPLVGVSCGSSCVHLCVRSPLVLLTRWCPSLPVADSHAGCQV